MRTTVDLPEDIHKLALAIAHDRQQTLSQALADLVRRGMTGSLTGDKFPIVQEPSGLRVITFGRPITSDDVRAASEDE
jgi:hypothetical protein